MGDGYVRRLRRGELMALNPKGFQHLHGVPLRWAPPWTKYGHLIPGNDREEAGLLGAYLERANTAARLALAVGDAPTSA